MHSKHFAEFTASHEHSIGRARARSHSQTIGKQIGRFFDDDNLCIFLLVRLKQTLIFVRFVVASVTESRPFENLFFSLLHFIILSANAINSISHLPCEIVAAQISQELQRQRATEQACSCTHTHTRSTKFIISFSLKTHLSSFRFALFRRCRFHFSPTFLSLSLAPFADHSEIISA